MEFGDGDRISCTSEIRSPSPNSLLPLVRVGEDGDAPGSLEAKRRARAIVCCRRRRNSCSNLNRGKYVIGFRKGSGVLTPDVRQILEPSASLRIDNAERLYRWSAGVGSGHIEAAVTRVVPDLITATHLIDDVDKMAVQRIQNYRLATRRHEKVLERTERYTRGADARGAGEGLAV